MRELPPWPLRRILVATTVASAVLWVVFAGAALATRPSDPLVCPPGVPSGDPRIGYEGYIRTWNWFPRTGITCDYPVVSGGDIAGYITSLPPIHLSVLLYITTAITLATIVLALITVAIRGAQVRSAG